MANNRVPIAIVDPTFQSRNGAVAGPTANTVQDGTSSSTSMYLVAQAQDGASTDRDMWLSHLIFESAGSPAATVARIYIYTGSSGAFTMGTSNTASNTFKIREQALPLITLSQTAANPSFLVPINMIIPAGHRVLVSFGTSTGASGTGYVVSAVGGFY